MGDRLRRLSSRFLKIIFKAAMPGILIYAMLLLSFVTKGTPQNIVFPPRTYLTLLIECYLTALVVTVLLEYRELRRAAVRVDQELIGDAFGGWKKPDKLFCTAMDCYMRDETRAALEQFLAVREYPLTDKENGVLSFYIGRCYQLLGCPSNAVPYYETAVQNEFPRHFAKLFQARSYAECGDFSQSYDTFCELLNNNPPPEFYFLYTDIGFLFIQQKLPDKAIEWFQQSIDKRQNYAFALSGMAIASLQRGDFEAAKDYRYKALINRVKEPGQFRKYYDETKTLMLEEHPEWREEDSKDDTQEK